jgi:hypothetical protein
MPNPKSPKDYNYSRMDYGKEQGCATLVAISTFFFCILLFSMIVLVGIK